MAGAEDEALEALLGVDADDVPEDRPPSDLDERLRDRLGVLPEPRAAAAAEDDDARSAHGRDYGPRAARLPWLSPWRSASPACCAGSFALSTTVLAVRWKRFRLPTGTPSTRRRVSRAATAIPPAIPATAAPVPAATAAAFAFPPPPWSSGLPGDRLAIPADRGSFRLAGRARGLAHLIRRLPRSGSSRALLLVECVFERRITPAQGSKPGTWGPAPDPIVDVG